MVVRPLFNSWLVVAKNNLQTQLLTISSSTLFIVGKLLVFLFTLLTIYGIFTTTDNLGGYSFSQAITFAVVYNLMDSFTQFLFRSIYSFRPVLVRGEFDLDLLKPLPSFFKPILSGPDFFDLPSIVVQSLVLAYLVFKYHPNIQVSHLFLFFVFFAIAVVVSFSIHLLMAAFSIMTLEIDNVAWVYRSFMRAGIAPTDIYSGGFRFLLDYIVPVTLIVTIPAKALLGLINLQLALYCLLLGVIILLTSLFLWRQSLRFYTSAGG